MEEILSQDNLNSLLEEARGLDPYALSKVVKLFYPRLYRYFFYRAKTKEDAEDLTSDVFVRLVESIKKQKGNFTAWLFAIARNLLIDYYRKRGRLKEVPLDDNFTQDLKNFSDIKDGKLAAIDLKKLLINLTDEQQEVIVLKFIDGRSNREISQIMKRSEGAIKALQFRALAALREILKREI